MTRDSLLVTRLLGLMVASGVGAQAAPSTDVYLVRLRRPDSGVINITNREGYDNQPNWDGGRAIWFTSRRDGQTDIWRYDIGAGTASPVTSTPESEYSAAPTPDGSKITVIRVEKDSTQRLWNFPRQGAGEPAVVLPNIKPVGYFAWLDSTTLALFVLGSPNTLQIADTRTGTAKVVTTGIGRSLQKVPFGARTASFTQRSGNQTLLQRVTVAASGTFRIDTVAAMPDSAEYVAWLSPSEVLTAAGSRLMILRLPSREWDVVADLSTVGIRRISRLALSPPGSMLAIVAEEPRAP